MSRGFTTPAASPSEGGAPARTMARIAAFMPGASRPLVRMASRFMARLLPLLRPLAAVPPRRPAGLDPRLDVALRGEPILELVSGFEAAALRAKIGRFADHFLADDDLTRRRIWRRDR